jgi:MFS family permease
LLTAAIGVGALSGALSVAVLRPSGGSGRLLIAGLTLVSTSLVGFAVSRWVPLSLVALAVLGASQVAYYTTTSTLIQMLVPARLRGRVSSIYVLASLGVIPFGNLFAGIVAERFGPPWALAGGGVATLLVVGYVVATFPELVRLEARSIEARE